MALRQIIDIDEAKCTGCGECATGCPEGALRMIDGKARMVGENLCDGIGACIGTCPTGAITVIEREAEAYEEARVMEGMVKLGPRVLTAHLEHLAHHGQDGYVREALAWLEAKGLPLPAEAADVVASISKSQDGRRGPAVRIGKALQPKAGGTATASTPHFVGCSGSAPRRLAREAIPAAPSKAAFAEASADKEDAAKVSSQVADSPSALTSWPIKLHLVNPRAPQFADADLLIAADCTAFSLGGFHATLLEGKSLVIACPKLDQGREMYIEKLTALMADARSVTVAIMEVPCCTGLLTLVQDAREAGTRKPGIRTVVLGIGGGVVKEARY
jgi:NAD-dependent dihydropyrimidine dehydrogenase PreA subunit